MDLSVRSSIQMNKCCGLHGGLGMDGFMMMMKRGGESEIEMNVKTCLVLFWFLFGRGFSFPYSLERAFLFLSSFCTMEQVKGG